MRAARARAATAFPAAHSARRDALWIAVAFVALALWDRGGLDLAVARHFGTAQGFAWQHQWFMDGVMHRGLRAAGWLVFAWMVVGIWWPRGVMRDLAQRDRAGWVGTTALCAALIPLLKRASATSCPWSLAEFGGGAGVYVPHWVIGQFDGGPGGCFPSGHASTAFAFLAGWFWLRGRAPRAASAWLAATLVIGAALGAAQLMRGAHYPSHILWTGWICWAVTAASFHALRGGAAAGARDAPDEPPDPPG